MKKMCKKSTLLFAMCTLALSGCSDLTSDSKSSSKTDTSTGTSTGTVTEDTSMTLSEKDIVFETPDATRTLKAYYDGEEAEVTWSIDDKYIALLDSATGTLKALSGGTAKVTATLKSDESKTVTGTVTVSEPSREVTSDPFDLNTVTGNIQIITCGDSIMRDYGASSSDQYGLGQAIKEFFDESKTEVNTSVSNGGRSSRKFYNEESRWPLVKTILEQNNASNIPTVVILSFGHNDERTRDGSDAAIDSWGASFTFADENQNGTTAGTLYDYMERFIVEARERGAVPVLATPFVRAYIGSDGKITQKGRHNLETPYTGETKERGDYAKAMIDCASKHNAICIDLTSLSAEVVEKYSDEGMLKYFYVDGDATHERTLGGLELGKIITDSLKEQGYLTSYIKSDVKRLMVDTSSLAFGRLLQNASKTLSFSLSSFGLESGQATVTVPQGYGVSLSEDGEYSSSLTIDTDSSFIGAKIYVSFTPSQVTSYNGYLTVSHTSVTPDFGNTPSGTYDGSTLQVALTGAGKEKSSEGSAVAVLWPMVSNSAFETGASSTNEDLSPSSVKLSGLISSTLKNGYARVTIDNTGNIWPVNDTGVKMDDVYLEYAVPAKGLNLTVNKISFDAASSGGSYMRWSAYYSTDPDFTNPDPICEISAGSGTKDTLYTESAGGSNGSDEALGLPVNDGDTLYIRIYPAYKDTKENTGRQFMISNVTVEGLIN